MSDGAIRKIIEVDLEVRVLGVRSVMLLFAAVTILISAVATVATAAPSAAEVGLTKEERELPAWKLQVAEFETTGPFSFPLDLNSLTTLGDLRLAFVAKGVSLSGFGFDLRNGSITGELSGALSSGAELVRLKVSSIENLFGARLHTKGGNFSRVKPQPPVIVEVQGLDLAKVLQQYPSEKLVGQGVFDGQLPLLLGAEGWEVKDGSLLARAPGGSLRILSEQAGNEAADDSMALIRRALKEYAFSEMRVTVNYRTTGELQLAIATIGRSEELKRDVNLNVNLTENVPELLKSIAAHRALPQQIEQSLRGRK